MSQFTLLTKKRFGPFFWTQFLGAFNDNLFKNSLLIMFAFQGTAALMGGEKTMDASTLVNLSAGLFILPFFLFSALAGQLADKFEKGRLIRWIKLCEIGLMSLAAFGFIFNQPLILLALLFLMGTQSAFFGPVKYSILPQHLKPNELVGGNGMVEMGTFLAILLGTIAGGVLIALEGGKLIVGTVIIAMAIVGWFKSRGIPHAPAATPELRIKFNPITETWKTISFAKENTIVFRSILGISWFWFYGAIFLAQMPTFTEKILHGDEHVVTLLLTIFSVGIGAGSLMCEKLSHKRVELGLVPFGAIGLTLFALDLWWASSNVALAETMGFSAFLSQASSWHITLDILGIGLFGGFYIVPLYALIQQRSAEGNRSRVIAGNNILNAFFMVLAASLAILVLSRGFSIPQLFLLVAILNALVALYIFSLVPEFLLRFIVWIIVQLYFRIKTKNQDLVPEEGGAILVANTESFLSYAVLSGVCHRPIRFVVDHTLYKRSLIHFFFKAGKAIPLSSQNEHPETYQSGMDAIAHAIQGGEMICIFPDSNAWQQDEHPIDSVLNVCPEAKSVPLIGIDLNNPTGSTPKNGLPSHFRSNVLVQFQKSES